MGVLPHTFKFKTNHNIFFRRVHRVAAVRLILGQEGVYVYEVTRVDGSLVYVPYTGTVAFIGKKIHFTKP